MLEIRHLEIVDAIARAGTVTAAARRLHLTQPAVSHALANLEARLGVSLFHRTSRGMRLTSEGERLHATARHVLDEIRETEHELARIRGGSQGVVRIATECYTCYHWLPPILEHFSQAFPDIDVHIAPEATSDPIDALLAERLDLAIVHNPVDHPDLATEELFEDEIVAVVERSHRLAELGAATPADFEGEIVLLHSDPEDNVFMREFLGPEGVQPMRVLQLQLTEAILQSVRAKLGVSALAKWAVQPDLDRGDLVAVRLGEKGLHRRWRLVTHRGRARRSSIQELARLLTRETGMRAPKVS